MTSFDKEDSLAPEPAPSPEGSLPDLALPPPEADPSAFDIVTRIIPSIESLPISDLEVPYRKAAFLQNLGSQKLEEFEAALGYLKNWLPKQYQTFFWPVVLEVLSTSNAQQVFASHIRTHADKSSTFLEIFLKSLLDTVDSCPVQGPRQLRCRSRILTAMVWWTPHAVSQHLAKAIDSDAQVIRPFAISVAFAARLETNDYFHPSRDLCRYLEESLKNAATQQDAPREVLLSGGSLQLASSFCSDLMAIGGVLSGRLQNELFSKLSETTSINRFVEAVYRWAERDHADDSDPRHRRWRLAKASFITAQIADSVSTSGFGWSHDDRDLFQTLLRFSFWSSTHDGIDITQRLLKNPNFARLAPSQEAALAFVGNELSSAPHSELSKHLASPATLEAFLSAPDEMQTLALKVKQIIEEESQKTSPAAETSLSKVRLDLLFFAQSKPPGMSWWKVLTLITTEDLAAKFAELWQKRIGNRETFLDKMALILPSVKDAADLMGSYELLQSSGAQATLESHRRAALMSKGIEIKKTDLLAHFITRDTRDISATEKLQSIFAELESMKLDDDLSTYMRLSRHPSRVGLQLDPLAEVQTYRSFIQTFGPLYLPTLYDAYRTLHAGVSWGQLLTLDDLLAYRLNLLEKICHDDLHSVCSDPVERELIDQICHLRVNTFGEREGALATIRDWNIRSAKRKTVYNAALASSPSPEQNRKSWAEQHTAAKRAESAWAAFSSLGPTAIELTTQNTPRRFSLSGVPAAEHFHSSLSDYRHYISAEYTNLANMLASNAVFKELLAEHPFPQAGGALEAVSWQRTLLRASIETTQADSLEEQDLGRYRFLVSLLVLRTLTAPPGPDQKGYVRYNVDLYRHGDPLDQQKCALLWVDIAAGLFEGNLADQFILSDVTWNAERRQEFMKRLRSLIPCDAMIEALEGHFAAIQTHPHVSNSTESCTLTMIPTRGIARELSGHLFDVCWAAHEDVFSSGKDADEGRQNIIGITFVKDYNSPRATIVGGSLVVIGYETHNSKQPVMIIRGCNPRDSFLRSIYVGEFFDQWVGYLARVAQAGQMTMVIPADNVPSLALTNQPDLYYYARNNYFSGSLLDVGSVKLTEFNRIRIGDRLRRLDHHRQINTK
jgi:hypothetical protein